MKLIVMGVDRWAVLLQLSCLVGVLGFITGCHTAEKQVVPKQAVMVEGEYGVTMDNEGSTLKRDSSPLRSSTVAGGSVSYFIRKNLAVELGGLHGKHELENDDGERIGRLDVTPVFLSIKDYRAIKQVDGLSVYLGAGVTYSYFNNEEPEEGIRFDVDDTFGGTGQVGLMYFIDPAETVFFNARLRGNFLQPKVNISNSLTVEQEEKQLLELIPSVSVGVRF